MDSKAIHKALMESAIYVVAHDGVDHVTTSALAKRAGLNEVYIYRVAQGKETLLRDTFEMLDVQFRDGILRCMDEARVRCKNPEERFPMVFHLLWQFALKDRDKCLYFIRYYYSRLFGDHSYDARRVSYEEILKRFARHLKPGADPWFLMNFILDVFFTSIIKVLRNQVPDTPEFEAQVFHLIYPAVRPHLAEKETVPVVSTEYGV